MRGATLFEPGTNDLRADRPKQYYPIFVSSNNSLRIPQMKWREDDREYEILEHPQEDETVVWPIGISGGTRVEKNWERGWDACVEGDKDSERVPCTKND